jgi:hypothetical protein
MMLLLTLDVLLLDVNAQAEYSRSVDDKIDHSEIHAYRDWLKIEWYAILFVMLSNMVFLGFRYLCRNKVVFDKLPHKKQMPDVDTVSAVRAVININNSFAVPTHLTFYL